MAISSNSSRKISKILACLSGAALIALAIYKYYYTVSIQLLVAIWTFYWIIFGIMLILNELNVHLIRDQFSFLDAFCGKGLFLILYSILINFFQTSCGTLMIDSFTGQTVHESIVGILIIICGFAVILLGSQEEPSASFPPSLQTPPQIH